MSPRALLLAIVWVWTACGHPAGPTPVSRAAPRGSTTWQGHLSRADAMAMTTMTVEERPLGNTTILVEGRFVAVYPSGTISGSVGGVIDGAQWSGVLLPAASRTCPTVQPAADGTTVLTLSQAGGTLTGQAVHITCEGRTTWNAEFIRR